MVPHFLAAPLIVAQSDLVMVTERVAHHFAKELDLTIFEPPVPMRGFTIDYLASVARATDPTLQWLRDQIFKICSEGGTGLDLEADNCSNNQSKISTSGQTPLPTK